MSREVANSTAQKNTMTHAENCSLTKGLEKAATILCAFTAETLAISVYFSKNFGNIGIILLSLAVFLLLGSVPVVHITKLSLDENIDEFLTTLWAIITLSMTAIVTVVIKCVF